MTGDNGGRGREQLGADNGLDTGSGAKERHGGLWRMERRVCLE